MIKANQLPQEVEARFQALLAERNWLVHSSCSSSRDAIYNDQACNRLIERLKSIAEEAHLLLKEVGMYTEGFVKKHGVSVEKLDELAAQTLKRWHQDNAL
jgi:hypothetical protein